MIDLREAGLSYRDISARTGLAATTVCNSKVLLLVEHFGVEGQVCIPKSVLSEVQFQKSFDTVPDDCEKDGTYTPYTLYNQQSSELGDLCLCTRLSDRTSMSTNSCFQHGGTVKSAIKVVSDWSNILIILRSFTFMALTTLKFTGTIPHVLEDTPLINRQHIHFLHDGAPAHFSRTARRYLDRRFPDRWIGRGGPIAWPPRSPDLNPLDFYLWGHLKSLVYSSPVPDLESLRNRILACSEDIRNTPGVWDRVRRSMRHRCELCTFTLPEYNFFIIRYAKLKRVVQWSSALAEMCKGYAVLSRECTIVQQGEIESIPLTAKECTLVHCVFRGGNTTTLVQMFDRVSWLAVEHLYQRRGIATEDGGAFLRNMSGF
ncbi:hypothetical protein ANN_18447 [Periplaneta americana]|uniref:Tc1-like transposase DDE domain-containing protein n=1 Tax=Periplaneta americana TaxID=6978 RepID=A0ABQ8SPF2_PERAM|nr:hypothetical protein ANN_18447 [Periplaneta americana]